MNKRILALFFSAGMLLTAVGCGASSTSQQTVGASKHLAGAVDFDADAQWDAIVEQVRGTTVTFYGWGGDEERNRYLMTTVADALRQRYELTLALVPMDIDQILSQLSGEKQAGVERGSIDMIWINGENFYSAKENGMLFGPFADKLPAYQAYIDAEDAENRLDFGYPIEGYEAPYGKAQMVLIGDSVRAPEMPKDTAELLEFAKKYKGQVTYPAPPDFTGSAFVRNVIYDICGDEQFVNLEADKETVRDAVAPAMAYLRTLGPFLWNEGKTFPATSSDVENMFLDGELVMHMSYSPYAVATGIDNGTYPNTAQTFLFDGGMIGNTNYIAISSNAPNKAGAMVAINYILSAEGQLGQFAALRTLPVVDNSKLNKEEAAAFGEVEIGRGVLTPDQLLDKRLPEMPAQLVPIIEEIWQEEVVGK